MHLTETNRRAIKLVVSIEMRRYKFCNDSCQCFWSVGKRFLHKMQISREKHCASAFLAGDRLQTSDRQHRPDQHGVGFSITTRASKKDP